MKYIYSGPASGVTLADGQEVLLWPNSEISLPEDNEWVITMIAAVTWCQWLRKK